MAAFKNKDNGTWYVQFRYTDWRGERQQKLKRGFPTKKAALAWEREFLMKKQADLNMTLESFVELYTQDIKPKLKLNTWLTKECIIQKKILPYLGKRKLSEITPQDIFCWQNEIRKITDKQGKPLSTTYLKTIHNQMSAIFNHAVRYYGLQSNPAAKAGSMGEKEATEMQFWTKEEFLKVIDAMMDSPIHYYAFEMLYWCGLRIGELFALTPDDFNFETGTVTISKSYQRIKGDDVITCPKTKKSNLMMQDRLQMPNWSRRQSRKTHPQRSPRKPTSKSTKPSPSGMRWRLRNWSGCRTYAPLAVSRTRKWRFISAPSRNSRK